MKAFSISPVQPLRRLVGVAAAILWFAGAIHRAAVAEVTDPNLNVTISGTSESVVLSWFGSNAISYQVESSATLTEWTNSSLVLTGGGTFMFVTNSIAGLSEGYYRVKRLIPEVISAAFDPQTGILTIIGDDLDNLIVVSRDAAGVIRVNGGLTAITGGVPTVANTVLIQIFGRAGNDRLSLDESSGALPKANLFGEAGNDTLIGGSGADILTGGPGSDTLLGKGGVDILLGGDDDDTVNGGDGDDIAQLGLGNDRFIWNPGDDTDVIDGGEGIDTTEVNGGNGAEVFTVTANGPRVRFDRVSPGPFFLDIGGCENLVLNANGGNDMLSCTGDLASLIHLKADGGPGEDTLLGSNGPDVLIGGDNNDFIDGNQGNDLISLGNGDDTFQWDPGDGSDTVDGEAGNDTLVFNGSATGDLLDLSANGPRLRFARSPGNVVLDVAGVETVQARVFGGADNITVNDLSATEVNFLKLDLAGPGLSTGDLQSDTVVLYGSVSSDNITATQDGADVNVSGLRPFVTIFAGETNDVLTINAQGGNDTVNASGIASLFALTIDGGAGDDIIIGSAQADVLIGGDDNDTITGREGNDLISGGIGDDTFVWNPGDGNDVLEGQAGVDKLQFNGSDVSENLDASANGERLRFSRDVGNVVLSCDDVEKLQVNALGGADAITVNELTGTDVSKVVVDLAALGGGGDTQRDSVVVFGTQTNDNIAISGSPGVATVTGLSALVTVLHGEPANDSLTLNALDGPDSVEATDLAANTILLILNGGRGDDELIGSQGADLFIGGDGFDGMYGGDGDDTFVWNPGDDNDSIDGQAGNDTLVFNGSAISEGIDLSANGTRLRFARNIATVVLDCADVEIVHFEAGGGADSITVNDLSATAVKAVNLGLSAAPGGSTGDGQVDDITIYATGGDENMAIVGSAGTVNVTGLSATVTITSSEGANDRLTVKTLAGDDSVEASGLAAGSIGLTVDGGEDDDILIGSAGDDTLLGGPGDDVLIGGPGLDALDGGPGNNVVIQ